MKNKLREIRKNRGLSQENIGDELGVEKSQISKLERGQTKLHSEWIRKLTPILNCTASELLGEEPMKDDEETINMSKPLSSDTITEILIQVHQIYPDEPYERKVLVVGKIYDRLKDELDVDPGYVRAFFKFNDLSNIL